MQSEGDGYSLGLIHSFVAAASHNNNRPTGTAMPRIV